MGLRTFRGGVHPFEGKELSKDKPVEEYLPKGDLVFPVSQHIGAPAQPVDLFQQTSILRFQERSNRLHCIVSLPAIW